ncbi:MAG: helix-turn-helix domain-containing protein [Clostridia bacterium]|nr:helix-turn-helix domain-containing protein [Clostridia bacterium]
MFGEKLKNLRKQEHISQQRLADMLGVCQSTVAMWEKGKNSPEFETLISIAKIFSVSCDYLTGTGNEKTAFSIPVLGYVRAGLPTEAVEDIMGYEDVVLSENERSEHFALRIKGDSMAPRMMEGDTVIVKKQAEAVSGDICVALVGNADATVKKVIFRDTGLILMPLNSAYDPLFFTPDEVENTPVTIIGKVVELRARI